MIYTRSQYAIIDGPRKTRSKSMKPDVKSCHPIFDEQKIPGGLVVWRHNKRLTYTYRYPVVVRISRTKTKGNHYKSVHAAQNTPEDVPVGVYVGKVVDGDVADGRWCVCVPGFCKLKALNSKITKDWPWEKYVSLKAVGGFFNSSRKKANSITSNLKGANCKLKWFYRTYDAKSINGEYVYAILFTRRSVKRGEEFLWDYNWLK